MTWVRVGGVDLLECDKCEGTWVEAQTFERLCADREAQSAVVHTGQERKAPELSAADVRDARASAPNAFRYRPCPLCAGLMNRVNFGRVSGAVVDVCKGHGTFLDRGELNRIVRFIQSGGIDRLRAAEREQLADERRRLQDAGRMHARMFPDGPDTASQDTGLGRLLSALLGW
jgi:Zn-finger nucleic acid-binding protein